MIQIDFACLNYWSLLISAPKIIFIIFAFWHFRPKIRLTHNVYPDPDLSRIAISLPKFVLNATKNWLWSLQKFSLQSWWWRKQYFAINASTVVAKCLPSFFFGKSSSSSSSGSALLESENFRSFCEMQRLMLQTFSSAFSCKSLFCLWCSSFFKSPFTFTALVVMVAKY